MLKAYRCKNCGTVFRPRRLRCINCKSREFEEITLNHGKLVSYTLIYATREGYQAPVKIGLAEFEQGVKFLAQLDCENPEIGMEVIAVNTVNKDNGNNLLILRKP
ncbi:MAG: zinc ribbon domain-containing protein [Aigarchaeota archaeon]|nr:zinc ribbon domain-containing protein [Aigarchaeota archaeon]MCX8192492.1 zinc ribbon domain-containing protein [Nitrososphaeria archaeon]MDW7985772.1 zinc ribbon domain-containing protein [Nitrososphaerota archaeon]